MGRGRRGNGEGGLGEEEEGEKRSAVDEENEGRVVLLERDVSGWDGGE